MLRDRVRWPTFTDIPIAPRRYKAHGSPVRLWQGSRTGLWDRGLWDLMETQHGVRALSAHLSAIRSR